MPDWLDKIGSALYTIRPSGEIAMRASVLLVLAVLIAALWAFDKYENDGHYTNVIEHEVGSLLGN